MRLMQFDLIRYITKVLGVAALNFKDETIADMFVMSSFRAYYLTLILSVGLQVCRFCPRLFFAQLTMMAVSLEDLNRAYVTANYSSDYVRAFTRTPSTP
jgi:hypothetical protein